MWDGTTHLASVFKMTSGDKRKSSLGDLGRSIAHGIKPSTVVPIILEDWDVKKTDWDVTTFLIKNSSFSDWIKVGWPMGICCLIVQGEGHKYGQKTICIGRVMFFLALVTVLNINSWCAAYTNLSMTSPSCLRMHVRRRGKPHIYKMEVIQRWSWFKFLMFMFSQGSYYWREGSRSAPPVSRSHIPRWHWKGMNYRHSCILTPSPSILIVQLVVTTDYTFDISPWFSYTWR